MYSIGQVAEMFGLPISTLRYYDKQGLFPNMERVSGIRRFSNREIEALRVIECLKKAGMEIKDIRQFMIWCAEGPSTYPQRKAMFEERKAHMESEIAHMNRALDMLKFKCCNSGIEETPTRLWPVYYHRFALFPRKTFIFNTRRLFQ